MSESRAVMEERLSQVINWEGLADNRPSDYIYALMSQRAYDKKLRGGETLSEDYPQWKVLEVRKGDSDYLGVLYVNTNVQDKHYVLAHRGTASLEGWVEDFRGIYLSGVTPQQASAYNFVVDAVSRARNEGVTLSFTGHSLGAFLASLSVFYCYKSLRFPVNAVTFESPGAIENIDSLQSQIRGMGIDLNQLDIVEYLSYPNIINTCNRHFGTLYQLDPNLGDWGWVDGWFTKMAHSMDGIVELFKEDERPETMKYLTDWPWGGSQRDVLYRHSHFSGGRYIPTLSDSEQQKLFELEYKAHYSVDESLSKPNVLPLRHFSIELKGFLPAFFQWKLDIQAQSTGAQANEKVLLEEKLKSIKPVALRDYLLKYSLIEGASHEIAVVLDSGKINEFRKLLSAYLSKPEKKKMLMDLIKNTAVQSSTLELISELASENSYVGKLENARAITARVSIPKDSSTQDVANAERLIARFQEGGGRIVARAFAPGSRVREAKNIEVMALHIEVGQSTDRPSFFSPQQIPTEIASHPIDNNQPGQNQKTSNITYQFDGSTKRKSKSGDGEVSESPVLPASDNRPF